MHPQKEKLMYVNVKIWEQVTTQSYKRSTLPTVKFNSVDRWSEFREAIPVFGETSISSNSLLEHMKTTKDKSDYLWYITR